MNVNLPPQAKPHEAAILYTYAMGKTSAKEIAEQLNYTDRRPVQIVLKKYRDVLPELRNAIRGSRNIGNNTIYRP